MGVKPQDRIALVAETGAEFAQLFFGIVYAGAWPVPLPLPTSFGGKESYIDQLVVQLSSCDPSHFLFPAELADMADEAARKQKITAMSFADLLATPVKSCSLPQASTDDVCYLQYSSGSTRFPHGVAVTHKALLSNLAAHSHGMQLEESDRCISWLPWYHDMGLVGCFLSVVANKCPRTISRPRILRVVRLHGWISSAAMKARRSATPPPLATIFAPVACRARHARPTGSICRAGAWLATART